MELTVLARLAELADQQFGQLTRRQATDAGADADELVGSGVAELVSGQVLRLRAGGRAAHPRLYAAWLELEPATPAAERSLPADGVVSHDSALRLYRVAGEPGPDAEFTVANPARPAQPGTVLHPGEVLEDEWTYLAGLPVTEPARTLIDLSGRYDVDELARMAESLVSQQWIREPELRAALERGIARRPPPGDPDHWIASVLAEVGSS